MAESDETTPMHTSSFINANTMSGRPANTLAMQYTRRQSEAKKRSCLRTNGATVAAWPALKANEMKLTATTARYGRSKGDRRSRTRESTSADKIQHMNTHVATTR